MIALPYLDMDWGKLYYEVEGEGPVVVLLHHGFAAIPMWDRLKPVLLEAGLKVVAYDRRGYGRSDLGQDYEKFYLSGEFCPASVDDLEALRKQLGLGNLNLVGQCEGGVIAVQYASAYPSRVDSLVLGSVQCNSRGTMVDLSPQAFPLQYAQLDEGLKKKQQKWHGEKAEFLFNLFRAGGGAYGVGMFDLRPWLIAVTCPSLVLYPDRSALFEVEQGVEMYRCLHRGELAVLPGCGHNTYEYRPGDFNHLVMDFYRRKGPLSDGTQRGPAPETQVCFT